MAAAGVDEEKARAAWIAVVVSGENRLLPLRTSKRRPLEESVMLLLILVGTVKRPAAPSQSDLFHWSIVAIRHRPSL